MEDLILKGLHIQSSKAGDTFESEWQHPYKLDLDNWHIWGLPYWAYREVYLLIH